MIKIQNLEDERSNIENKLYKFKMELETCKLSKETLYRDKHKLIMFLKQLGKAMQKDKITEEIGINLYMESLLTRAKQLKRMEVNNNIVKVTSVSYHLQRRIRLLQEQLQRRELHLDLLRRKLSRQEDNLCIKSLLQTQLDKSNFRVKNMIKQHKEIKMQLNKERELCKKLSTQLLETADHKIAALEKSRKIEDLENLLIRSDILKKQYIQKYTMIKEQIRKTNENVKQKCSINDQSLQFLRDKLHEVKQNLVEVTYKQSELQNFRVSVAKLLSIPICRSDYEIISHLKKIVATYGEFIILSERNEE
ncbi:PREDICTED: coiled-coil domain-containing protein 170 [Ceratosolen solmsi marchali]|uniref:Coiled-coil domain-containing protein 170 n=1 Tax=Ceratosolen solmsi marchali TaxID=326594 RepID=A0AAJ6YR78_9HYME|nr:PREDICTED: coiled-coil domain-containing protein 170 [Ceratosolen solmsi marchali]